MFMSYSLFPPLFRPSTAMSSFPHFQPPPAPMRTKKERIHRFVTIKIESFFSPLWVTKVVGFPKRGHIYGGADEDDASGSFGISGAAHITFP